MNDNTNEYRFVLLSRYPPHTSRLAMNGHYIRADSLVEAWHIAEERFPFDTVSGELWKEGVPRACELDSRFRP
jgi:hypothetical protein